MVLAAHLAVGDDVDAGALHVADRKSGASSCAASRQGLASADITRNADFDACARE